MSVVATLALLAGCRSSSTSSSGWTGSTGSTLPRMRLTSSAFANNAPIPEKYSCDGDNLSPSLAWSAPPPGTAQLAVTIEDPDAPSGRFIHWIVVAISPDTRGLDEGVIPASARVVQSSSEYVGYTGMCPPSGPTHHYIFTVWALRDSTEVDPHTPSMEAVTKIKGLASATGVLVGTFKR